MRKWGERRSFVRPPVEKHFESRRKAMIHMKLKATKFESQFLSGMLEGLYGTVKVGNTIQCQSDWLYRVKPNRSCEFLDENFLLLDNDSNARQQIETKLDSEVGCPKISFFSRIEPVFLYGMCIGHTRSHAKFQTSGLNILKWRPLFVNGS